MQPEPGRTSPPDLPITGRCYCGAARITAHVAPLIVTYCHCEDCKRSTGAPVAAYAAFREADLTITAPAIGSASAAEGAERQFCVGCGTPLAARYAYLPGQVYVALGVLDQRDALPPAQHAHADRCLAWLGLEDDLPRFAGSSRDALNAAGPTLG